MGKEIKSYSEIFNKIYPNDELGKYEKELDEKYWNGKGGAKHPHYGEHFNHAKDPLIDKIPSTD
ncbi:MAG: hypothetical protein WC343_05695 [Bacilli bacterium]|jgi:hypothetical protein